MDLMNNPPNRRWIEVDNPITAAQAIADRCTPDETGMLALTGRQWATIAAALAFADNPEVAPRPSLVAVEDALFHVADSVRVTLIT